MRDRRLEVTVDRDAEVVELARATRRSRIAYWSSALPFLLDPLVLDEVRLEPHPEFLEHAASTATFRASVRPITRWNPAVNAQSTIARAASVA